MYREIKKITKILFCLVVAYSLLNGGGKQIMLNNGMWQAVGVQGIYDLKEDSVSWDTDNSRAMSDVADKDTTYFVGNKSENDNLYVNNAGVTSVDYITNSSPLYASIGIFAIKNAQSRKNTNYLTLDGTKKNSVYVKVPATKEKDPSMPMYRMYIEGKDNVPTIRVDYQANYEGGLIRIKFGNEKIAYFTYFNSSKTYSHPADLYDEDASGISQKGPIKELFDFNISDNNITLLKDNRFKLLNKDGTIGGDGIKPYNSSTGDTVLVYHYQNSKWLMFNSNNVNIGSNDFDYIEPGKGYWIQANSVNAHKDGNKTKIGLIAKSDSSLMNDTSYKRIENGWNMMSFPDVSLRYAATGMFISMNEIMSSGVNLFLTKHGNTNVDMNSSRDLNITLSSNNIRTVNDAAQLLNSFVELKRLLYGYPSNIRSFPALSEDNLTQGLIILSNGEFECNSSLATTLSGDKLHSLDNGYYGTKYGDFVLAVGLNDLSGSDINGSVEFFMPSSKGRQFHAVGVMANDINYSMAENNLTLMKFGDALRGAATKIGNSAPSTNTKAYLVELAFDGNDTANNYSQPGNFDKIFIASGARFFIRDATYTRIYKFENNGSFLIKGDNDKKVASGENNNTTIQAINAVKNVTNVIAVDLTNDYFAITSSTKRNLDLLEDNQETLFSDIGLQDTSLPANTSRFVLGVIGRVYTYLNLLSPKITLDMDYFSGTNASFPKDNISAIVNTGLVPNLGIEGNETKGFGTYDAYVSGFPSSAIDLRENSIWALDFPEDGIIEKLSSLGKEMKSISTMNFSADNRVFWSFIDLTKNPDTWYREKGRDNQNIFALNNQKAYWVNIQNKTYINDSLKKINVSKSVYQKQVVPHFDNSLVDGIGVTKNNIDHTLNITFNESFINPIQSPYYDVMAVISGQEYRMRYSGSGFQIRINSAIININEKNSTQAFDPILIKAYDGIGNNFVETPSSHTYQIEYFKPATPKLTWNKDGELDVQAGASANIEYYLDYISDIPYERKSKKLSKNTLSQNTNELGWIGKNGVENGKLKKIKVVARQSTTQNQSFYSDIVGFLYAPLKFGHVLKVKADLSLPKTSFVPYSFLLGQMLTKRNAQNKYEKYNGLNGVNNGVQITLLKTAIDLGNDIKMVYYPFMDEKGLKEGDKKLTAFGGTHTMYLKISTPISPEGKPIAQITYIDSYIGSIFYIYYHKNLYQGVFQGNNNYNSDTKAYNLASGTKGVSFNSTGNEGYKVGFSSNSAVETQPIIIPGDEKSNNSTPTVLPLPN